MMGRLLGLLLVTDLYPLWCMRRANARSTLIHAVYWAIVAWVSWVATVVVSFVAGEQTERLSAYVSLCLVGCAGVAVLGARRPGMVAWSFVVLGLLTVQMLQVAEGLDLIRTIPLRIAFLSITLGIALGNYLPTRLAPAALLAGVALAPDLLWIVGPATWSEELTTTVRAARGLVAVVPWLAYYCVSKKPASTDPLDERWRRFRDSYGFVWAQRLRDQFNRSAVNAGWTIRLGWTSFRNYSDQPITDPQRDEAARTLLSLMRRFDTSVI
jgi:hypothetical protein